MSPSTDLQRGRPYRRRLFAARHSKRNPLLRLARPFLIALFLVGSPAAVAAWVLTAPEFTLQQVRISGALRVPMTWVEQSTAGLHGFPLLELPIGMLESRIEAHPWVARVRLRKRLPDLLRIELIERVPVAVVRFESELTFTDAEGVMFAEFDPAVGASDLLLVSGSNRAHDLRAALHVATVVERTAPIWGEGLSEVEILNERDFRLYCAAFPFPLVVSTDRLEVGLENLRANLSEIEAHLESVGAVDLRFERYIVIQPVNER